MKASLEKISKERAQNSKHLIADEDKSKFVEVSPWSLDRSKAELVGNLPIVVSQDAVASKALCQSLKNGDWPIVLATKYYPQLAMAGYLRDLISLEEVQTVLQLYTCSIDEPDLEITAFSTDKISQKIIIESKPWQLVDVMNYYLAYGNLQAAPDKMIDFPNKVAHLPISQRDIFLVLNNGQPKHIIPSIAMMNLMFSCAATKTIAMPIQGRLNSLTLDDIERSVRKNQRYIGFSYPGGLHVPTRMMDYGLLHDYAHFLQQLQVPQKTSDMTFHLVDNIRQVSGIRWTGVTWDFIDNPITLLDFNKTGEHHLIRILKFASKQKQDSPFVVALIMLDIISNEKMYKEFNVNPTNIYQEVMSVSYWEDIAKYFSSCKENLLCQIIELTLLLVSTRDTNFSYFDFLRDCNEIKSALDPLKVTFGRKRIDGVNRFFINYESKIVDMSSRLDFLKSINCEQRIGKRVTTEDSKLDSSAEKSTESAKP